MKMLSEQQIASRPRQVLRTGIDVLVVLVLGMMGIGTCWRRTFWESASGTPSDAGQMIRLGAQTGDMAMIQRALARGVAVDAPDEVGVTAPADFKSLAFYSDAVAS